MGSLEENPLAVKLSDNQLFIFQVKDLVRFLGIKDGMTASMASQGTLSDEICPDGTQLQPPSAPHRRSRSFELQGKMLERSMTTEVDGTKHKDKKDKQRKY